VRSITHWGFKPFSPIATLILNQHVCTCQYFARPGGRRAYTGL